MVLLLEATSRFFLKIPSYSKLSSRYEIDGISSVVLGYIDDHETMPFALKSNFSHIVVDNANHPMPFKVDINSDGYRNVKELMPNYDEVIVGDSVAFGYGVDNNQTISSVLAEKTGEKIYNLAIPGAGPAMYMQMIYKFLMKSQTRKITILFYDGNDYKNLMDSYWKDMSKKAPPVIGKIYRKDVSERPAHHNVFYLKIPLVRSSALFYLFNEVIIEKRGINIKSLLSNGVKHQQKKSINREKAIKYLKELYNAPELSIDIKNNVLELIELVQNEKSQDHVVFNKMKRLSQSLISKEVYPISKEKSNLLSMANSSVFLLIGRDNTTPNTFYHEEVNYDQLSLKDKLYIFLNYLKTLEKKGVVVRLILLPAEYRLNFYKKKINENIPFLIEELSHEKELFCLNLIPKVVEHYDNESKALFLDGSHLNVFGVRMVADWITEISN